MSNSAKAVVHLKFKSKKQLHTLLDALIPETKVPTTHRAAVQLKKNDKTLTLVARAEDTVALRATLNAYLHWITSTLNVIEVIEKT